MTIRPKEIAYEGMILCTVVFTIFFAGYALGSSTEKTTGQDWPIQVGFVIFVIAGMVSLLGFYLQIYTEQELKKNKRIV